MSGDVIMKATGVSKEFPLRGGVFTRQVGSVKAVQDVSFTLRRGETLGLVGESGCGKSTLGRTLLRLEEPTAGGVEFNDMDIFKAGRKDLFKLRRSMQMIFQDPYSSLNPRMTVEEIIREPFTIHGIGTRAERREKVQALLAEVGLKEEMGERYPHEFSGGQRQRVGIARALALQPDLIVADEPVSALDVSVAAQVINLLVRLQKEHNLTYIFISHDLAVVEYISDRIAIMYLGRIVEVGNREQIFKSPAHPYTRALIASSPVPDPRRRDDTPPIKGEIPSP
ncbi:MAG: ABC transporter ATP-binding protein, partial [Candidatus Sumerlaeia bacterium]|nr:ABC transporter ATP-binding protein [Candidatus Sumerlaeia bacterium]